MTWLYVAGIFVCGIAIYLALMASIALFRTGDLDASQRIGQLLIVWMFPVLGPLFILHLLAEHDIDAIPTKWIPNERANAYLLQALGIQARGLTQFARGQIENEIVESISESMSDSGGSSTD